MTLTRKHGAYEWTSPTTGETFTVSDIQIDSRTRRWVATGNKGSRVERNELAEVRRDLAMY